jgi:ketosteroid isomerase-like protein
LAFLEISDGGAQAAFERRCVTEGPAAAAIAAISTAAGSQTEEELRAAGIEELMNADRAFNALAQSRGAPAAFVEFAHDDVVLFRQGFPPYRGKDGVRARFAGWPAGAKLSWAPEAAEVSARGDMGWIWGRGDYVAPDGKRSTSLYVSVWRRDLDGAWRYVTDLGVDGPAALPASPAPPPPPAAPAPPKGSDLRR